MLLGVSIELVTSAIPSLISYNRANMACSSQRIFNCLLSLHHMILGLRSFSYVKRAAWLCKDLKVLGIDPEAYAKLAQVDKH